jgi:dienelactone hydrolase
MIRATSAFLAILLALAACAQPASTSIPPTATTVTQTIPDRDALAVAERFAQAFIDEQDFAQARADFDATMQSVMSEQQVEATWAGLNAQFGDYQGRADAYVSDTVDKYIRVAVPVTFEQAELLMRVVVDSTNGQISGLFFVPAAEYTPPAYADPDTFEESELTIGEGGAWELPGTLTMPKGDGPFAAVVLVHGSGPNDRDETIEANKPFKDLAWGLASQGIAVLRYDKRSRVYGAQLATMNDLTVKEEVIDDALAAVELLRRTDKIDPQRIFVLGHSLGGMLAPRIAEADGDLAGLIILAGATRPLEDVIIEQTEYLASLSENTSPEAQRQIDAIQQAVAQVKALTPEDAGQPGLIIGAPASYWLDLRDYDPAATAARLSTPMLVLQGERDYQVTLTDFAGWQAALSSRSDVQLKTYAALNHLFIAGAGPGTPAEYATAGNVEEMVIEDIAMWIDA